MQFIKVKIVILVDSLLFISNLPACPFLCFLLVRFSAYLFI
jgi:hypothetical protein